MGKAGRGEKGFFAAVGLFAAALLFASPLPAELSMSSISGEEVWRLNCGAETFDYTDPNGNWWVKDEPFFQLWRWGFDNGWAGATQSTIQGTNLQAVYQTSRSGGTDMSYKIELPSGLYQVKLMFAETYFNQPGQRVFDVALEGVTVLTNHDVVAEVGAFHSDDHTFWPTVTDGVLDITFPRMTADFAMISGIEIKPIDLTDQSFLEFIQRKMFWYFWNEADPATGLVKDRENNWGAGFSDYSSIAATGFGLSAISVAASRGWVSPQDARDRIMTTLNTFDTVMENKRGFWYHFVNPHTGARNAGSEISNVDSGIFIMGALQAGEYFKAAYPEIAAKADQLYRRMEWNWWLNRGPADQHVFLSQGWKPEIDGNIFNVPGDGGYFRSDWWNRYAETPIVNFLAFASPDYSISTAAWTGMLRQWENYLGYHQMYQAPLFTHQYQNIYVSYKSTNNKEMHDGFANYNENTRAATLHNRQACLIDPQGRYETNRWGLTAADGPGDVYTVYGAPPDGAHDGTVAPTAAIASIPYTPQESIAAARYMYFQYKHHIWGRYGFTDGFNVQQNFRSQAVLGLDQGPMILAIENYLTGMVQNTSMANPYLHKALKLSGFREYSEAPLYSASTVEGHSTAYAARSASDGNPATRWSSAFADPQWLSIEYAEPKPINRVVIQWEAAYAKSYKIQVSNDGANWTDVYSTFTANGGTDVIDFPMVSAKFVRMYGTERGSIFGYSIFEMTAAAATSLLLQPASGAQVSGTVNVSAVPGGNGSVQRVEFSIDGVVRSTDTSSPYNFSWDTTLFSDGPHQISAMVFDGAGGATAVSSVTVMNFIAPASGLTHLNISSYNAASPLPAVTAINPDGFSSSVGNIVRGARVVYGTVNGWSGGGFTFDNFGTGPVETVDIRNHGQIVFGVRGDPTQVKFEMIDDADRHFVVRLSSIQKRTENLYAIPVSLIQNSIDASRVRLVYFIVEGGGQNGELYLYRLPSGPAPTIEVPPYYQVVSGTFTASAQTSADIPPWNTCLNRVDVSLNGAAYVPAQLELGTAPGSGEIGTGTWSYIFNSSLLADGTHQITARVTNSAGQTGTALWPFVVVNDSAAPVLSNHTVIASATVAAVLWTTDEPADSQVEYGTSTAYGFTTPLDTALVTSHSAFLIGLNGNTLYHYRVISKDFKGNAAVSNDRTFTTQSIASSVALIPQSGALVSGTAHFTAAPVGNAPVQKVEFSVDGVLSFTATDSPYIFAWDSLVAADYSTHQISAKVTYVSSATAIASSSVTVINNIAASPALTHLNISSYAVLPPLPAVIPVTAQGTSAVYPIARGGRMVYATKFVPNGDWAGAGFAFTDFITPQIESVDLSSYSHLVFGLRGDATQVKLDVLDDQYGHFIIHLTGIEKRTEKIFAIPTALMKEKLNLKIQVVYFVVEGAGLNGELYMYRLPSSTLPVVNVSVPLSSQPVSGNIVLAGTASASMPPYDTCINKVEYQVDGGSFSLAALQLSVDGGGAETGAGSWSGSLNTGGLSNGPHTLNARVTNSAGQTFVYPRAFTVNNATVIVDTAAPVISSITALVTVNAATIAWRTNEASNSQVEYGTSTAYGSVSALNPAMVITSHSILLSNLQSGLLYHYRVKSLDAAGNLAVSENKTFTTGTNLLVNAGFESAQANWSFPAAGSIDTAVFHGGTRSAKLFRNSNGTSYITSTPNMIVTANQQYRLEAWVKSQSVIVNAGAGGTGGEVMVRWINYQGTVIREDFLATGVTGTVNWRFFSATFTSPAGAQRAQVRLRMNNSRGTVWYDDLMMARNSIAFGAPEFLAAETEIFDPALETALLNDEPQDPDSAPEMVPTADPTFKAGEIFAYPNPARSGRNPVIHVECGLADSVEIRMFDTAGDPVGSVRIEAPPLIIEGRYAYEHTWDASGFPSGVYIYRVVARKAGERDLAFTKKMAVIK